MKKLFLLLLLLSTVSAVSQTYVVEPFTYGSTAGPFCGTGGVTTNWVPHANAGSSPVAYLASNLSYSTYTPGTVIPGSMSATLATGTRESIHRVVTGVSSGSVYLSFALKITPVSGTSTSYDYFVHFSDTFGSAVATAPAIGRFCLQNPMLVPGYKLGITKGSSPATAIYPTTIYTSTQTLLVVMRYMFNTSSTTDDSLYAWVFTSGVPATEPAPAMVATDMTVSDLAQIRSVCVRQGNATGGTAVMDYMRLGTAWSNTVLPVSWLAFTAAADKGFANLAWSTASEFNNDHFEIERSTGDEDWKTIGSVKAKGNSSQVSAYHFADRDILPAGIRYYRLKQADHNGQYTWSKTVSLHFAAGDNISLYPNPFNAFITASASARVILRDFSGKEILRVSLGEGEQLPTGGLNSGVYIATVIDETGLSQHFRLIKR